jgi:hypothetical protein
MRFAALSVLLVLTACTPPGTTEDQTSSGKVVVTGVRTVPHNVPSDCPPAPDPATLIVRPLPVEEGLPPADGGPPKRVAKVVKPDYPLCFGQMRLTGIVDFAFTLETGRFGWRLQGNSGSTGRIWPWRRCYGCIPAVEVSAQARRWQAGGKHGLLPLYIQV